MVDLEIIPFISNSSLLENGLMNSTYEIAAVSMTKYLNSEQIASCVQNLQDIDDIENNLTIENLRMTGDLSDKDNIMCQELVEHEIHPNNMTLEEARKVHDYVNNVNDDIINDKIEKITDVLTLVLNGKNNRRTYEIDEVRSSMLMYLIEKGTLYENGKVDISRTFDHSVYPRRKEYFYRNMKDCDFDMVLGDEMSRREFENIMDIMTDEELLDEGYIHEDDVFQYGPYTNGDLRNIEIFLRETWIRITDPRRISRLESFLNSIVGVQFDCQLEGDLHRNYITNLIIPTRRLNVRNMISMLSSFGQQCNDVVLNDNVSVPLNAKREFNLLRRSLHLCSYYASLICGMRTQYLKNTYKVPRPIVRGFYLEILSISDSWTDAQISRKEIDYGSFLIKLDEHLFEAQAAYANLTSIIDRLTPSDETEGFPFQIAIMN